MNENHTQPTGQAEALTAKVVRTCAEVDTLRREWELLRERCAIITPNADFDRFIATLRAIGTGEENGNGPEPLTVLLSDKSGPRSMVVGRHARRRISCSLGYGRVNTPMMRCWDIVYGGMVIAEGDTEAIRGVVDQVAAMLGTGTVDHVMFNHLPRGRALHVALQERFGRRAIESKVETHWRFSFGAIRYDEMLKQFSSKHRYNIRRLDKLLVQYFGRDVKMREYRGVSELEAFTRGAAAVAAKTYQARLGAGFSDSTTWRAILQVEANRGRFRGYLLFGGGKPIAYQVGNVYGGTYFLEAIGYMPEFRELSPGTVLLLRSYKELCEGGVSCVDYGFGDADYKRIYGTENWEESVLHVYGRGLKTRFAQWIDRSAAATSRVSIFGATLFGQLGQIKKRWRNALRKKGQPVEGKVSQKGKDSDFK
jgi:CelD/BcsL family acetyltransferase involved in cellulose biosynthesis